MIYLSSWICSMNSVNKGFCSSVDLYEEWCKYCKYKYSIYFLVQAWNVGLCSYKCDNDFGLVWFWPQIISDL